ncbi:hypothetical protein [Humibacter sp. RRB41]|uniref:hypothetical protein n=1 Tax=Humibacter sp. RRB41 TaxID=2919946 RepID=UPI001FAA0E85|nr:hypothetical protein [Humibacter sp. RRB41]
MSWHEPSRAWSSGDWSLQLRDDEFAEVRFDGGRVLRSIRAVVRDHDWNTSALVIDDVESTDAALRLAVHTAGFGARLHGTVVIETSEHRLIASLDLVCDADYLTNRVGLVVLHAPQAAGHPLSVLHGDGTSETTAFPEAISPHQPVRDIAELCWSDDGIEADVLFHGDVFEMEDQRNWTDASYKTYSRPLSLPFPYRLAAGQRVLQRVEVNAARVEPHSAQHDDEIIVLTPGGVFPDIALGAATAPSSPAAPPPEPDPIGSAVLVELDLGAPNWRAALDRAAAAELPLDVRIVLESDGGAAAPNTLDRAVVALRAHQVARISAFQPSGGARHVSDAAAIGRLRTAMARAGISAPVVGGARSHFTELNREHHRLPADLDGIVFSITPLFHSLRTEQLIESLPVQRRIARQAVAGAGGLPVHIGLITLRPHFNDVATTPPPRPGHDDLTEGYGPELLELSDPRQDARELAAWTIASVAALAVPGVATLAYFEEWGARGIRSASGEDLPVAAAVRRMAQLSGCELLSGDSADGMVWAIGAVTPHGGPAHGIAADRAAIVLVANLDDRVRTATVRTPSGVSTATVPAGGWVELPS